MASRNVARYHVEANTAGEAAYDQGRDWRVIAKFQNGPDANAHAQAWGAANPDAYVRVIAVAVPRTRNPAGRPKSAATMTNAQRQAKFRAARVTVPAGESIPATIAKLAADFDLSIAAVTRELLRFALCNKNWQRDGFPTAGSAKPGTRQKNPVPASKHLQQIEQASRLYTKFSGHEAEEIGTVDRPLMPDVLIAIGEIDGVLYSTVRDNQLEKYIHKFSKKARPLFAVSPDGKQLFMLGGAYDFTERGIVDQT